MKRLSILTLWLISCSSPPLPTYNIIFEEQSSGTTASLRGLAVVDSLSAWASGSQGTVLRTTDGGTTWLNVSRGLPDTLDFRDIEAFTQDKAIIMTAGYPGQIYKTIDGGKRWHFVHEDLREEIFYDAMVFWNDQSGIIFGDAIHNRIVVATTNNSGVTWQNVPEAESPEAVSGEGGFAASGTCIATYGDSEVWIALGTPNSRVLHSSNRGKSWDSYATPMAQEATGAGIFSLAFATRSYGIAVGGNYLKPIDSAKTIAITENGGKSWQLVENSGIGGYKSAVAYIPNSQNWLATGPSGVYYSSNNGKKWIGVDTIGYHAVDVRNNYGWLTGGNGRIAKFHLTLK